MGNIRIYLDNCCCNRTFDDQMQMRVNLEAQAKLYIHQRILEKKLDLVYSFISRYENELNPFVMRKNAVSRFFGNAVCYVDENSRGEIKKSAEQIMLSGVGAKDALHIACAIFAKCDYFISTDKQLLNYQSDEIRLIDPIEFITETEV